MTTDRVAVDVQEFTLATGPWETVYTPPKAPIDIAITLWNQGPDIVEVWTSISNAAMPLPPGMGMKCNSSGAIKARAKTATALLTAAFGIELFSASTVTSDGLTSAEAKVIALGNTKKELLARLIIEMKINNEYHRRAHNDEVTARDLGNGIDHLLDSMV
jgi:hypothetical protein